MLFAMQLGLSNGDRNWLDRDAVAGNATVAEVFVDKWD
jgi:hypothetical protein